MHYPRMHACITQTHIHIHMDMHLRIYIYMYICIYVYRYTYVCAYVYVHFKFPCSVRGAWLSTVPTYLHALVDRDVTANNLSKWTKA